MRLKFTKMHGLGNDFIVFDAPRPHEVPTPAQLRRLADRRTGIGFDQALVLSAPRSPGTDVYYRIFNADGTEVEQCGNGARCIATLVARRNARRERPMRLGSPGGVVDAVMRDDGLVSVAFGVPDFDPRSLPFEAADEAASYRIDLSSGPVEFGAVSIGNPHAVIRIASVADATVDTVGPAMENHARFPRRVNVGFVEIVSPEHVRLRVFERERARPSPAARAPAPRLRSVAGTARLPTRYASTRVADGSSSAGVDLESRSGSPARPKRPSRGRLN